jgi:hypothetical protein
MRIYIAGKITGLPINECILKFQKAEYYLRDMGADPVNPMKLGIPFTATREEAMPQCLKALNECTAIFMLSDYKDSIGAGQELAEAKWLQMDLFFEDNGGYEEIEDLIRIGLVG